LNIFTTNLELSFNRTEICSIILYIYKYYSPVSFTRKTAALNIRSIASSSKQMKSGLEHSDLCILSQYIDSYFSWWPYWFSYW